MVGAQSIGGRWLASIPNPSTFHRGGVRPPPQKNARKMRKMCLKMRKNCVLYDKNGLWTIAFLGLPVMGEKWPNQSYGKITLILSPAHISDHFEHPECHNLMDFWVTYCHILAHGLTLWSHDPPDWRLGGGYGKCPKNVEMRILAKKAKNEENAQKYGKKCGAHPPPPPIPSIHLSRQEVPQPKCSSSPLYKDLSRNVV
jgi:hypothetical protein